MCASACKTNYSMLVARTRCGLLIALFNPVPVGRLNAEQVMNEEVGKHPLAEGASRSVTAAGHQQQIVILVGLYERINNLERRRWVYVGVHFADNEQKLAFQPMSVVYV